MDRFKNRATTTLATAIDAVQTAFDVASNMGFPSGNFRLTVGGEIMLVTGLIGTNLTVVRGAEGSSAASHNSGSPVNHTLTAASLLSLIESGPIASRPAPAGNGGIYLATDSPVMFKDQGTSWLALGPLAALTIPPVTGWSNISFSNSGGITTLIINNGSIWLGDNGTSGEHIRMLARPTPARPYNVTIGFLPVFTTKSGNYPSCGIMLLESGTDKRYNFGFGSTSGTSTMDVYQWNNGNSSAVGHPSPAAGTDNSAPFPLFGHIVWYRVCETSSMRLFSYSTDGVNFIPFFREDAANTTLAADMIGIYANTVGAPACGITLLSWKETP